MALAGNGMNVQLMLEAQEETSKGGKKQGPAEWIMVTQKLDKKVI